MKRQISQQNQITESRFPDYLNSYGSLIQHFRGQLKNLSTTEKGNRFERFVQRLAPRTEIGLDYDIPDLHGKSGDKGVDLIARSKDGRSTIYIQAKMWVDEAVEIDSIVSKFQAYEKEYHSVPSGQQHLFNSDSGQQIHFLLVTLSRLTGIRRRYEKRAFASREFYQQLIEEGRLHFIDGDEVLSILQVSYRKISELPTDLTMNLETQIIRKDNVFFGIVSSEELRKLYNEFGDALFFENIRDFLGVTNGRKRVDRTTPNDAIVETINEYPDKMLERNNGIVIRADNVKLDDSKNQLTLSKGSVVNGCQTTMCLVEHADEVCYVPVKVVQTDDSWDIAKAANYQNSVSDIELELARFLRRQLVKRAATKYGGVQIDNGEKSAFQIIDEIYDSKVAYDETRLLYIGLFSRTPNNIFRSDYAELMYDLIDRFYQNDPYEENILGTLFMLQSESQRSLTEAEATFENTAYASMFDRFYKETSLSYRCFISVLALCGAVNTDLSDRKKDGQREYERTKEFLNNARSVFENRKERFSRYYTLAVKTCIQEVMHTDADSKNIIQQMRSRIMSSNFTTMFQKLCVEADWDDRLRDEERQFSELNA